MVAKSWRVFNFWRLACSNFGTKIISNQIRTQLITPGVSHTQGVRRTPYLCSNRRLRPLLPIGLHRGKESARLVVAFHSLCLQSLLLRCPVHAVCMSHCSDRAKSPQQQQSTAAVMVAFVRYTWQPSLYRNTPPSTPPAAVLGAYGSAKVGSAAVPTRTCRVLSRKRLASLRAAIPAFERSRAQKKL